MTRQRTPALVISFQETAQALAAEALFGRLSLPGRIIPLPSRISAGCGLAWKADPGDETVLTAALDENGLPEYAVATHIDTQAGRTLAQWVLNLFMIEEE